MDSDTEQSINTSSQNEALQHSIQNSLDSKVLSTESRKIRVHINKPSRSVIIEPLLLMREVFAFPYSQVYQLYIYQRMEQMVAGQTGFNMSNLGLHSSHNKTLNPCTEEMNKSSPDYNFTQAAQSANAHFSMVIQIVNSVPCIMALMFFSGYCDKVGRKYAILPGVITSFISASVFLAMILFDLPVWVLLGSNFLSGITGGSYLLLVGCYAYIADITTKEERQFRLTLLTIILLFSEIAGPIGIGYWIKKQGFIWPVVFSVAGHLITIVYSVFFIPETVIKDNNAKLLTMTHLKRSARVYLQKTESNRRWKLWCLLLVFMVYCIALGASTPISLFELNAPLCWGAVTLGYYKTVWMSVCAVGGLLCSRFMTYLTTDQITGTISAIAKTGNYVYLTLVKNTLMMFLGCGFSVFTVLLAPTTRALMSKHVTDNEQGSMFGMLAVVEVIARFLGSELFDYLYAKTLYISAAFVFYIAAFLYLIVVCLYIFYSVKASKETVTYQVLDDAE